MKRYWYLMAIAATLLASCNKDEEETEIQGFKVLEYRPAPGQFINEGFDCQTMEEANAYAEERFNKKLYVSLGSFGGYITVKMPKEIKNRKGYDFGIIGNPFSGSSEPGIVWVSEDANGNGKADDVWYELKGSDEPEGKKMDVQWISSDGRNGWVDYLSAYHTQDYYYPAWISENSYTLTGTCLAARNTQDSQTGYWDNQSYDWGYVDNFGNDQIEGGSTVDGSGQRNGFKISNAIHADGTEANLQYIDFIKIQCGVLAKSGWLGEVSTEVFSFEDLTK